MSDKEISIALLGYGTVGSNVYGLLQEQQDEIAKAIRCRFPVRKILVRDLSSQRTGAPTELFTTDFEEILRDDEISIVVELMGGIDPAFDYISAALKKGLSVVTANKQLLSQKGAYLFDLAAGNSSRIRFEASVAGAVPVIKVLRESMVAADLTGIYGIVNGTTNYILTEMGKTGASYDDSLTRAQQYGYAEADPTEDVNGKDAAAKMAILASIGFHTDVSLADVACEGIDELSATDIAYARELGFTIKLLGVARLYGGAINVRVYPALVPFDHPLASVKGAYNAVFLKGSSIHEIMLSGPGAGGIETASAVVSDIVSIATTAPSASPGNPVFFRNIQFFSSEDVISTFYLRLEVEDRPGVLGIIANAFGEHDVSIESVIQKGRGVHAELVMIFHPVQENSFMAALDAIRNLSEVKSIALPLRVEGTADDQ